MPTEVVEQETICDFDAVFARSVSGPRITVPSLLLAEAPEPLRLTIYEESYLCYADGGYTHGTE